VHREAAYFHWQNRGGPVFDDWKDWFSVQRFLLSHIDL